MTYFRIFNTLIFTASLLSPQLLWATSNDHRPFSVRNHNPFTRVFGLPMYPDIYFVNKGQLSVQIVSDIVNHADGSSNSDEELVFDGESYLTNFLFRYGATKRLELGLDIPHVAYHSGFLDGFIEDWHDFLGLSNANREGKNNKLQITYTRDQITYYDIDKHSQGIGDIRLSAAYRLSASVPSGFVARASLKLPTGNSDELRGSDGTDVSLDISFHKEMPILGDSVAFSAHAGVLILGNGEVLSEFQKDAVIFGGSGLSWKTSKNVNLVAQLYGQGSYFDSDLDELGSSSLQFVMGGRYIWPNKNLELGVGVVQDMFSDTTPDVAFHFDLRMTYR